MPRFIEKIRVPVRLARAGMPPETGCMALAPHAELHEGPETLLERLNAPTQVVPFLPLEVPDVLLLMRAHIEWVEADLAIQDRFVRPATFCATSEEPVQVCMFGGEVFEGVLAIEMPDEFNRTSDYLNGDEMFFPVRMDEATRLVNKRHVVDIRLRGAAVRCKVA